MWQAFVIHLKRDTIVKKRYDFTQRALTIRKTQTDLKWKTKYINKQFTKKTQNSLSKYYKWK